jgi:hypothetical protein
MSASYEAARRVALGLERKQQIVFGEDLWNISLGDDFGTRADMPFQFFGKGFEPPDEQTAQKTSLMLYDDEYEADRSAAALRLEKLEEALRADNLPALSALLSQVPVEEWLSLIFLEGKKLEAELPPLLQQTSSACRACLVEALDAGVSRLVVFQDLLKTLRQLCLAE